MGKEKDNFRLTKMRINDFELYKDLLSKKSGLVLTPDKSYLLDSRLTPVARTHGFANLEAMTMALRGVADEKIVKDVIEAMTTNETSFFRDTRPFDVFKNFMLPYMVKARSGQRKIRIWCAAGSTGQEPYSLAMLIKENEASMPGWKFEIVATDISKEVINIAKEGLYSQFEVQRGLPIQLLMKYFTQKEDKWQLSQDILKMVRFEYFNLLEDLRPLGQFDMVFCRNVLIYFDEDMKKRIFNGITNLLPSDGFLVLGGAETVLGLTNDFKPMPNQRGVYVLTEGQHIKGVA